MINGDWTFAEANTQYLTHGLHPYPARMIPQIARRLIECYSKPGDVVLDPFCGSGGVLVESRLLGRNSIGIDINPLALILAKAKTTPITLKSLENFWLKLKAKISKDIQKLRFGELGSVTPPKIPNLDYWFKPQVARELTIIKRHLDEIEDEELYNFFATCFSIAVRRASNLKPGEFKIVRMPSKKLKKHNPNVFQIFVEHVEENLPKMAEFYKLTHEKEVICEILFGDARRLPLEEETIDLVVTSPPYGDSRTTVAYGQFSRYSALWLGLDERTVMNVDKASIGGSPRSLQNLPSESLHETIEEISKRSAKRSKDTLWYFIDLYDCLKQLYRVFKKGGSYCCFVVGNRTVRRVQVPTDKIIAELSEHIGFKHKTTIYRRIPIKRMPWENAPENIRGEKCRTIAKESIVILSC